MPQPHRPHLPHRPPVARQATLVSLWRELATVAETMSGSPQCGHARVRGVIEPDLIISMMVAFTDSVRSFSQLGQRLSGMARLLWCGREWPFDV